MPDKDNCIPITDEEYFEDDIVGLFASGLKQFTEKRLLRKTLTLSLRLLETKEAQAERLSETTSSTILSKTILRLIRNDLFIGSLIVENKMALRLFAICTVGMPTPSAICVLSIFTVCSVSMTKKLSVCRK